MRVVKFNRIEDLEKLRPVWDNLYEADMKSNFFATWGWQRGWAEIVNNWMVLAVKQHDDFVSFLMLGRTKNRLILGGNPYSDHTGFVCSPDLENDSLKILSTYILNDMEWDSFELMEVFDSRLDVFLKEFMSRGCKITFQEESCCPYVELPKSWDEYLMVTLNKKRREKMRRNLRDIEGLDNFRVAISNDSNIESHLEYLLDLWQKRFTEISDKQLEKMRRLFLATYKNGCLIVRTFWHGNTIVGVTAEFVDRWKNIIYGYIFGFNQEFHEIRSPGRAIKALQYKTAIENGVDIFDTCRGEEAYKFDFGAKKRFNNNVLIEKNDLGFKLKKNILKIKRLLLNSFRPEAGGS